MIKTIEIAPHIVATYLTQFLIDNKNKFLYFHITLGKPTISNIKIEEEKLRKLILEYLNE